MRIIDADALERQIQEAYCAECENYNGIRCRACSIDDALIQVDAAPTIAAIPVEWLESKRKEALHEGMRPDEVEAVEMVLWMWQKEQEEHST